MRKCNVCKIEKELIDFNKDYPDGRGIRKTCKSCYSEYRKINKNRYNVWKAGWRDKNRELVRKRNKITTEKSRVRNREYINSLKTSGCARCGKVFQKRAMDFHHINQDNKYKCISELVCMGVSIKKLDDELKKCELLCILCHRDETYRESRKNNPPNPSQKQKRQEKLLQIVNRAKDAPCDICGIQYDPWMMDLDHIDPSTKTDSVAALRAVGRPLNMILKEIEKCRVLCAACHRTYSFQHLDDVQPGSSVDTF